jgi:hypothetical protein
MVIPMPTGPTGPGPISTGGGATGATGPIGVPPDVQDFLNLLESSDFNIQQPISEPEANEAIALFSVVNVMLGGTSSVRVGNVDQTDVLGVLTLFYGLQDRSINSKLMVDSKSLWNQIQGDLNYLKEQLNGPLGRDADVLTREAKRQFNLGRNNDVAGNAAFPRMFKRYVELVNDPLLTLDLKVEQQSAFSDKEKIGKAYDILRDLKDVILQLVRSLSDHGTATLSQANQDWADFERRAMLILLQVAAQRLSDNQNDKNAWSVLADLSGRDRDTVVAPYIVLGRDGGQLLTYAMQTYQYENKNGFLDLDDENTLVDLFQRGNDPNQYMTTLMRKEASIVKRYPVANWA